MNKKKDSMVYEILFSTLDDKYYAFGFILPLLFQALYLLIPVYPENLNLPA